MYRGKFYDLNDLGNRRWRDADGRFVKGIGGGATPSTSPRQKIDLRRDLKRGEFERPRR